MTFFDFLHNIPRYKGRTGAINRLNWRWRFLVQDFEEHLKGARALDLAAHDGRWSYALAKAGAGEVVGVEARANLIKQFADYPEGTAKDRVALVEGDMFEVLPDWVSRGESFDIVAIYGVFYHVMDHYRLLRLTDALNPRLIVIDSEFMVATEPIINVFVEESDNPMNAIKQLPDQEHPPIGVPSHSALELMAHTLGYSVTWTDWEQVPRGQRQGLADYYRKRGRRRGTCTLHRQTA